MYSSDYNICEKIFEDSCKKTKGILGKGKIKIRFYDEIPPSKRKNIRTRIKWLNKEDHENYLVSDEKFEKRADNYFRKKINNFQVYIKPSKTLLTKLGFGLGVNLRITPNCAQSLDKIINIKNLHDYLLTGEVRTK